MIDTSHISDAELRLMRNAVYPANTEKQVQSDESWEQVKGKWRDDAEWLRAEYCKVRKVNKP